MSPTAGENGTKVQAPTPIPLTLSSVAHIPMSLPAGIAGGLTQVIQHSIMSCLHFAVATRHPFEWTVHDLVTSPYSFYLDPNSTAMEIPNELSEKGFSHVYSQNALIYLRPNLRRKDLPTHESELQCIHDPDNGWMSQEDVLGCISLHYATKGELTAEQIRKLNSTYGIGNLDVTTGKSKRSKKPYANNETPLPPAALFKAVVESRSVPPTGSVTAVKAEIASMITIGGSVDDDVKYGALSALHDRVGKYVLDIYSVRGKRYTFDLQEKEIDAVNPNKPVAQLKSEIQPLSNVNDAKPGPSTKSLCVTVANHNEIQINKLPAAVEKDAKDQAMRDAEEVKVGKRKRGDDDDSDDYYDDDEYDDGEDIIDQSTKSRLCFTLQGPLRNENLDSLPNILSLSKELQNTFLSLRQVPPHMATALPSEQTLLLDPEEAGRVYLHGRYVTTWGQNVSHLPALFGMDLIGIPYWHGQICDYDMLRKAYGQMWQDILIDARLMPLNIGGMLLSRLKTGHNPTNGGGAVGVAMDEDDDEDEDMDAEIDEEAEAEPVANVNTECLESQVMQSLKYDPVGISAKALATKFKMEYGPDAFPCQAHETDWVRMKMPGWRAIVVPLRVILILRRGGYFDVQRSSDDIWFATSRQAKGGIESELVRAAVHQLHEVGLRELMSTHVVFINSLKLSDPIGSDGLVRFNPVMRQYHVNEQLVTVDMGPVSAVGGGISQRANLLAMEIAKYCPDRSVLTRYLLRNNR